MDNFFIFKNENEKHKTYRKLSNNSLMTTIIKSRTIWTSSEEDHLLHQFKAGVPIFGIAQAHNRTETAVAARLEHITRRLYDLGVSIPMLADHTGQSIQEIKYFVGISDQNDVSNARLVSSFCKGSVYGLAVWMATYYLVDRFADPKAVGEALGFF